MNEDHLTVNLGDRSYPINIGRGLEAIISSKIDTLRRDGRKAVILIDQGVVEGNPEFCSNFLSLAPGLYSPARRDFQIGFGSGEGVGFFGHQPDRSVKLSFRDWRRSDGRPRRFRRRQFSSWNCLLSGSDDFACHGRQFRGWKDWN